MNTTHIFNPVIRYHKNVGKYSTQEIQDEPMLYGATINYLKQNTQRYPITSNILFEVISTPDFSDLIVDQAMRGYHPVIDTKVVMLMPGMYPCIGGWHCDGVIRKDQNSQPDLSTLQEPIEHFICTISDVRDHCSTEIITSPVELTVNDIEPIWGQISEGIGKYAKAIETYTPESGEIVQFNRQTLHRGTSAKVRQWRYFFRLSFYHMPAMNQERKQVQVYSDISKGW